LTNIISNQDLQSKKININVLVAPLDWGLGHATRCIPVLRILLQKGCHIFIAAEGAQEKLLRIEFPEARYIQLPGYGVTYSKKWLMAHLMRQLFKLRRAIGREHTWLKQIVKEHGINWVISDNRYGLAGMVPSVIMTHQLYVRLPRVFKWAEKYLQEKLYGYINNYDACWVPDLADGERGLSGLLGHPEVKPSIPVRYIGWLSRFMVTTATEIINYKCLIILSGPEPQRTILENLLVPQLRHSNHKIMLVRGLPIETANLDLPENITVFNHLASKEMQKAFYESEYIISRSGYSTLMDAFTLQKKCIFIPTPGQTEQEYVGSRLAENGMALLYKQDEFDIEKAFEDAANYQFHFPLNTMNNLLEMAVDNFMLTYFGASNH
jgi:uncharacterized protein (TIGR00661 family)